MYSSQRVIFRHTLFKTPKPLMENNIVQVFVGSFKFCCILRTSEEKADDKQYCEKYFHKIMIKCRRHEKTLKMVQLINNFLRLARQGEKLCVFVSVSHVYLRIPSVIYIFFPNPSIIILVFSFNVQTLVVRRLRLDISRSLFSHMYTIWVQMFAPFLTLCTHFRRK